MQFQRGIPNLKCSDFPRRSQIFLFQPVFDRHLVEELIAISETSLYFVILLEIVERKPKKSKLKGIVVNSAFVFLSKFTARLLAKSEEAEWPPNRPMMANHEVSPKASCHVSLHCCRHDNVKALF